MNTFEDFLKDCLDKGASQVRLVPRISDNGAVAFYAHPQGVDGDTFDGVAVENAIVNMVQPVDDEVEMTDEELSEASVEDTGAVLDTEDKAAVAE